ncbi:MAG TPA: hypothetical protein VEK08_20605 [Planctomycetota bacterium]|nr:hypothetical protein [Planctomycetota bacterium]
MNSPASVNKTTTTFRALDTTTTLRPTRLLCPSCARKAPDAPVLACTEADKIDFFSCHGCGGAWFHEKDMDAVLRATGARDWPRPPASEAKPGQVITESGWACPCCAGTLVGVRDRRGSGATVRRCLVCYGGWMEHEDLVVAADASRGVLTRLGQMIRTLLPQ